MMDTQCRQAFQITTAHLVELHEGPFQLHDSIVSFPDLSQGVQDLGHESETA